MVQDRRNREGDFPAKGLLLAWAAVCAIMLLTSAARIASGRFPDPDDVLRLVQVRDLLGGQPWFDAIQHRIDPPGGTTMHWSRLVDIPLLAVIAALKPLLGQPFAELAASILVPLCTFGVVAAAVGRLAWRLLGARVAIFAVLACGFLPALLFQFQPMRIDHHGWQVASLAVALWAIGRRRMLSGGWIAGVSFAFALSVSLELVPLAGAFGAVLFARWWADHRQRDWLIGYMQGLSLGLLVFYLATRGASMVEYCDAISPAHIAFFLVAGFGTWLIGHTTRLRGFGLVLLFAFVAVFAMATFVAISPTCVTTPFAALNPLVDRYWYRLVLEGQPIWNQDPAAYVPALVQMLAALGAVVVLRMRGSQWARSWWSEYFFLLLAAIALGCMVTRSLAFASVLAAIPLGWLAANLLARLRQQRAPASSLGIAAAIIVLLAPNGLVMATQALLPSGQAAGQNVADGACDVYANAALLARLDRGTVLAPLDLGPVILRDTSHSVVATGHHRAADAMGDVIQAFTAPPDRGRALAQAHGANYVALCSEMTEVRLYVQEAPDGLAAQLSTGRIPSWLERIDLGGPEQFAVYRVRD